jgi:methionyl-tRNA formyltransferase
VEAGHDVALVVSRPDRRRGRREAPSPSPVKKAALELGIAVAEDVRAVLSTGVELGVVVAFGRLVPAEVLARVPMVNLHFSLLPRWRGAAPVERAILAGDEETGVCLMALEEELDAGGIYACRRVRIGPEETAAELAARLTEVGTELLVGKLQSGLESLGSPRPQEGDPTYAPKLDPSELRLDWSRSAEELSRVVRVGRAWTTYRGRRLLVHRARALPGAPEAKAPPGQVLGTRVATGNGMLEVLEVQPEGRRAMAFADWIRGLREGPPVALGT